MNAFGLLAKSLLRDNPHELLLQYRIKLDWAINQFRNTEEDYPATLKALLIYDEQNDHCPPDTESLRKFIDMNTSLNNHLKKSSEVIFSELDMLDEDEEGPITDPEMLMRSVFDQGLTRYDVVTFQNAAALCAGDVTWPSKSDDTGPDIARVYIADRQNKRMDSAPRGFSGDFVEHLGEVSTEVDKFLGGDTSHRILTGFKHIDEAVLIGPKHQRWIGLLGYLNHGKSGLLMSMLYNMAASGQDVVFVPREFSVMDAWQRFLWMHANKFPHETFLELNKWKGGGQSNLDHWRTKNVLIKNLQVGGGLKGSIDVQNFSTWNEIEGYLKIKSYKKPATVLAVDYIGHLDVEGRNQNDELNKVFRKAQLLTQNGVHNDGNGLVVITPLQANKKHYEEARDTDNTEEYGVYKSAAAVDYFSQAARDMDLLMGMWSEGDLVLKDPVEAYLYCLKSRGMRFRKHSIEIDAVSRHYRDLTDKNNLDVPDINAVAGVWEDM